MVTGMETYDKYEVVHNYKNLEPRVTVNYIVNDRSSLKASYARNVQYLHYLSNSSVTLPTDLWIASSKLVKPQKVDQFALEFSKKGFFLNT